VKVAAYQAPLDACRSPHILDLLAEQVEACESGGVEILCCPEAVLGGLADYSTRPHAVAINVENGQLGDVLRPLASSRVTTIVGFTEIDERGCLFNSAAVYEKGAVVGVYRKHHPAINTSIYAAGQETPVVPTNNGLPPGKGGPEIVARARNIDIARARENTMTVIRAEVAGQSDGLVSFGSSGVVGPDRAVISLARALVSDLITADIAVRSPLAA
jgi:predicted amidohydrolase